jgi:hypothetical protein
MSPLRRTRRKADQDHTAGNGEYFEGRRCEIASAIKTEPGHCHNPGDDNSRRPFRVKVDRDVREGVFHAEVSRRQSGAR